MCEGPRDINLGSCRDLIRGPRKPSQGGYRQCIETSPSSYPKVRNQKSPFYVLRFKLISQLSLQPFNITKRTKKTLITQGANSRMQQDKGMGNRKIQAVKSTANMTKLQQKKITITVLWVVDGQGQKVLGNFFLCNGRHGRIALPFPRASGCLRCA